MSQGRSQKVANSPGDKRKKVWFVGQKYEQAETSQIGSLGCLVSPKKTFKKPSLSFSRYGAKRKTNPRNFCSPESAVCFYC